MFSRRGYKWTFKDGTRTPTYGDITEYVLKAIDQLKDKPDLTQIEFGRLIVQKHGSFYDVYVQVAAVSP